MEDQIPRRYAKMKRNTLNVLAIGGDSYAQQALLLHQQMDRLIDKTESLLSGIARKALGENNEVQK